MRTAIQYLDGPFLPLTQNWIYEQIRHIPGYRSIVYCDGLEDEELYPVHRLRALRRLKTSRLPWYIARDWWTSLFLHRPEVHAFLALDRPHVIHAHFGPAGFAAAAPAGVRRVPLVTTFYGFDLEMLPRLDRRWHSRYHRLFEAGDRFLVEGPHMRQMLLDLGCPAEKASVHRLGVDMAKIPFRPRTLGRFGTIGVLVVGRFTEKKGFPGAVEAFAAARARFPGMHLTIVGDSTGNPESLKEKARILERIERCGVQDAVHMPGFCSHERLREIVAQHHILLSPSLLARSGDTEGGAPVILIEAAASGMPVVASDHADNPYVVLDNETGHIVPERDGDRLSEALIRLAAHPRRWARMGMRARRHVEARYDARQQGRELAGIYDEVARG